MSDITDRIEHLSPLKRALLTLEEMEAKLEAVERAETEPIAIIGLGCRFPGGASNPEKFWQVLRQGIDAISEVPPDRWDVDAVHDLGLVNSDKVNIRWGGFLEHVDQFDAGFFGISPREATAMDPQQRLLLEVAREALKIDAEQSLNHLKRSQTGVFIGISSADYSWFHFANPSRIDAYTGTGTAHSIAANRLSHVFNFQGPSIAVDTACSSSLVAVHLACLSLRQKECDLALAGGVNVILSPLLNITFAKTGMMAPDGRCKAFDARADGYVRGEGCGIVALKRLSDAQADGDNILALIRGSAVNQDGHTGLITAPYGPAQQDVIRQALAEASVDSTDITYIEAHGTGTARGDPIEIEALASVFDQPRSEDKPCAIGSVKTNIGHLEAAAGIAGLIKVVLALKHQTIPPNLHFKKLNPEISLQNTPFIIPTELFPWPQGREKRYAGISSFGFGGTNAHVILEQAPLENIHDERDDKASRYLWQRKRYWLEDTEAFTNSVIKNRQSKIAEAHPLLGRHLQSAHPGGDHFWEIELDKQRLTYLVDHRIQGVVVLPGTAYLEMILSAAQEAFGGEQHSLTQVAFQQPLFLSEQTLQTIQVIISTPENGEAPFHIYSRPAGSEPSLEWTLNVTGKVWPGEASQPSEPTSPKEIRARCSQEISGKGFHQTLRDFGVERGPSFQGMQRLWVGRGEALGQVRVPDMLEADVERYFFHPAVFDACLQVLAATLSSEMMGQGGKGVYLPTHIEQLHIYRRPGLRIWSHARLRQQSAETTEVDIWLLNETGHIVAEILGLRVQSLTPGIRRTAIKKSDDTLSRDTLLAIEPKKRQHHMESYLREQVAQELGLSAAELDVHQPLNTLQIDSIAAIELESRLEVDLGITVPIVKFLQGPSIAQLAEDVLAQVIAGASITTVTDLTAEVELDPDIYPDEAGIVGSVVEPASIFLTGASGFLGAFLLYELLQQTEADVYCLVRAANVKAGQEKIEANLKRYSLWPESLLPRIKPIVGDLAQPYLGLSSQQFEEMARQVDVIYHAGALTNFIASYTDLKAPNVLGTQEVLRLAATAKVKPLHYISTISVFNSIEYAEDEIVSEQDHLDHSKGLYPGYAQSKWVAEKVVSMARSRGLPVAIYRPSIITGHSQTGVCNTDDFISRMFKYFVEFESVPDLNLTLDIVPIDYISQAIVHLSKQAESLEKAFHLVNPQPMTLSQVMDWLDAQGHRLHQIPYEQWLENTKHNQESILYPLLPFLTQKVSEKKLAIPEVYTRKPKFDCQNTIDGLAGSSIVCPPVDTHLLGIYFSFFKG
jgi:thioester reductase-like protein